MSLPDNFRIAAAVLTLAATPIGALGIGGAAVAANQYFSAPEAVSAPFDASLDAQGWPGTQAIDAFVAERHPALERERPDRQRERRNADARGHRRSDGGHARAPQHASPKEQPAPHREARGDRPERSDRDGAHHGKGGKSPEDRQHRSRERS